jgi:hypothetical protein
LQSLHDVSTGRYVFDEGEQGQPAYEFQREGDVLYVSVIKSEVSDGAADPAWQRVPCDYREFEEQVGLVVKHFGETLKTECGLSLHEWSTR